MQNKHDKDSFKCSRCLMITIADFGGPPDQYDPDGDMCNDCWFEVQQPNVDNQEIDIDKALIQSASEVAKRS